MNVHRQSLEMARAFVTAINSAGPDDIDDLREVLAMEATPDAKDEVVRALATYREAAPSMITTLPAHIQRALGLMGDLIETAADLSDDELLDGLRAFADLFAPVVFDEPPTS